MPAQVKGALDKPHRIEALLERSGELTRPLTSGVAPT